MKARGSEDPMALEIERKFLVTGDEWRNAEGVVLRQGYLSTQPERTVRVRTEGDKAKLTIKGITRGATRAEYEYDIPPEDAAELLRLCEPPLIEKVRRRLEHDGLVWEVDEFLGDNQGLVIAEVELDREDRSLTKPSWVGEEVTHDPPLLQRQPGGESLHQVEEVPLGDLSGFRLVQSLGVTAQYGFFILLRQILAREQLVDLMAALLGVEDFMRKVTAKEETILARVLHGKAKAAIVHIETNEDPSLSHLLPEIVAGFFTELGASKNFTAQVHLHMALVMRTIEPIQEERHPGGPSLEKPDAQSGEPIEDPVREHCGGLDHNTHGVPDGMNRIIGAEGIHAQVMQGPHMHGQGAIELLRFLVDGPVQLGTQMVL
jgi:adenylate cyclase